MESIDHDTLMRANAARVFSQRNPARRLDAIRELYAPSATDRMKTSSHAIRDFRSKNLDGLPNGAPT